MPALVDPRDADGHHLHTRSFHALRLRCAGCRARAAMVVVLS
jgi:hypothetical protein